MLFVQRPSHPFAAFYGEPEYRRSRPQYSAPEPCYDRMSSSEENYRRIAEEYQRKADIAKALATQEHQRALERDRTAKAVQLQRIRYQMQQRREAERQAELRRALQTRSMASCCAPRAQAAPRQEAVHPFEAFLAQLLGEAAKKSAEDEVAAPSSPKKVRFDFQPSTAPAPSNGKGKARAVDEAPTQVAPQNKPTDPWAQIWTELSAAGPCQQERMLQELGFLSPRPQPSADLNGPARRQATTVPIPGPSGIKREQTPVITKPTASSAPTSPAQPASPKSPGSDRFVSLTSIDAIETKFAALKTLFEFPTNLEFDTTSSDAKLLYTPKNAPFHQYESDLVKLITKLDAIESDGAESIRGARKALVHAIEAELDHIDALKMEAWKSTQHVDVAASEGKEVAVEQAPTENSLELNLPEGLEKTLTAEPEQVTYSEIAQEVKGYDVSFPEPEVTPEPIVEQSTQPSVEVASDASIGAVIPLEDDVSAKEDITEHDEPTTDHNDLVESVLVEKDDLPVRPEDHPQSDTTIKRPTSPGSEGEFEML